MSESKPSPIKEAAIQKDGRIWTGHRHGDVIAQMAKEGVSLSVKSSEQGFVDENGVFLNRHEAFKRAVICGQVKDEGTRILFSEDLY